MFIAFFSFLSFPPCSPYLRFPVIWNADACGHLLSGGEVSASSNRFWETEDGKENPRFVFFSLNFTGALQSVRPISTVTWQRNGDAANELLNRAWLTFAAPSLDDFWVVGRGLSFCGFGRELSLADSTCGLRQLRVLSLYSGLKVLTLHVLRGLSGLAGVICTSRRLCKHTVIDRCQAKRAGWNVNMPPALVRSVIFFGCLEASRLCLPLAR